MKSKTLEAFKNGESTIDIRNSDETEITELKILLLPLIPYSEYTLKYYGYIRMSDRSNGVFVGYPSYRNVTAKDFIRKVREEMRDFNKDDLVEGKYVVKFKNGEYRLFLFDGFINKNGKDSIHINNCYFDSKEGGDWNTAIEVFIINSCSSHSLDLINVLNDNEEYLTSVWKREEKSQARIEYEKLQEQIKQLQEQSQEQIYKLKEQVNKLESEIQ